MTTDVELAGEAASRATQDSTHTSRLDALRARVSQALILAPTPTVSTTFTQVGAKFVWTGSRNSSYINGCLLFKVNVGTRSIEVRVVNATSGQVLGTSPTISTTGQHTLNLDLPPASDAMLEVQIRQTQAGGAPNIESASIEFDTITGQ